MEIKAKSKRIADLKAYLETEEGRLQRDISRSEVTTDKERAGYGNHMAEDATAVFEQARNVGWKRDRERMLAQVEDALKRIADGSYGICRGCGQLIDSARLRALPAASLCFPCQEHLEVR